MEALIWILLGTFILSLISLIGILALSLKHGVLQKMLILMVSLSAGALMGGAFLHLLPEALEKSSPSNVFLYALAGFALFLALEKVLHWQHCHKEHCTVHTFAYMNLVGDFFHNFIDGLVIAAAFMINASLGWTATLAIALHEIPQEIGDFGVLLYGGFSRKKALLVNFLTAISCMIGGIAGYFFISYMESAKIFLLAFAAGGFIYISASDLVPEIRKEKDGRKALINFLIFLVGILIMYLASG